MRRTLQPATLFAILLALPAVFFIPSPAHAQSDAQSISRSDEARWFLAVGRPGAAAALPLSVAPENLLKSRAPENAGAPEFTAPEFTASEFPAASDAPLKARTGIRASSIERLPTRLGTSRSGSAPAPVPNLLPTIPQPEIERGLLLATRACGLLCDARRAEQRARAFSDRNRHWLAPVLGSAAAVSQGWLHGAFYSRAPNGTSFYDVHGASYVHATLVWGLTYVAGADPVDAYGAAIISNFFFQGLLNMGAGLPFINPTEKGCWDTWADMCVPKVLTGGARYGQLVVGAAIIAGPRLLRKIWPDGLRRRIF